MRFGGSSGRGGRERVPLRLYRGRYGDRSRYGIGAAGSPFLGVTHLGSQRAKGKAPQCVAFAWNHTRRPAPSASLCAAIFSAEKANSAPKRPMRAGALGTAWGGRGLRRGARVSIFGAVDGHLVCTRGSSIFHPAVRIRVGSPLEIRAGVLASPSVGASSITLRCPAYRKEGTTSFSLDFCKLHFNYPIAKPHLPPKFHGAISSSAFRNAAFTARFS